jgi:glycolate oxidase
VSETAGIDTRVGDLVAALPVDIVLTDPDLLVSYAHDESRFTERHAPALVLLPRTTDEVSLCLASAHRLGLPVVTRGAGSGLSGAANPPPGAVVLSTRRLNNIVDIDTLDRIAVVQPGVVTTAVRAAVAEHGLLYPPDPGSVDISSIGGNVATNAGGMCCVKYGVTGDFVLALEVVLADGEVLRTGRRTIKGVAGYDLTSLFVGSEGTLGVITEVTLRLLPAPAAPMTLLATFPDLRAAGDAVQAIIATGTTPSMLELLDRTTIGAIEQLSPLGFDESVGAVLLVQSDSPDAAEDITSFEKACLENRASDAVSSSDADESAMLLQARRLALPALERLGDWLLDDVCVPRSRVVELITRVEDIAVREGVTIGVFGHAGDGNMHPTVIFDESEETSRAAALRAFNAITEAALELGGTITGEHGVGRLKTAWLARELEPASQRVQAAIRQALDPNAVLNPGAVL